MTFSVVIPSYCQARYITDALASVVSQGEHLETLVLDGGSQDGTVDILKRHSKWINWWRSEKDRGQAAAVNEGVKRAQGEIIVWLNSDDLLTQDALATVRRIFEADKSLDMVVGGGFFSSEDLQTFSLWPSPKRVNVNDFSRGYSIFAQPSVFLRRKSWISLGLLDESLYFGLDYEFWIRCLKSGVRVARTPRPLSVSRVQPQAKTQNPKAWIELHQVAQRHFRNVSMTPPTSLWSAFGPGIFLVFPPADILRTLAARLWCKSLNRLPGAPCPAVWKNLALAVSQLTTTRDSILGP